MQKRKVEVGVLGALVIWSALWASQVAARRADFPGPFDAYLTEAVHLSAQERSLLTAGAPVTKLLEADQSKEVAVFGAVWVNASPAAYIRQVADIENFERGGPFIVTKRISNPAKPEDFAELQIPADDLADLQHCRLNDCQLKLGEKSLQALRTEVDWKKPTAKADAEAMFRRLALEYVTAYRSGGNQHLAVYRDSDRPTFVANEFRSMIDRIPSLATYLPDLRQYLLDYPRTAHAGSTDFLYWQETAFGLKPTIRINHLVIQQAPQGAVVASKMLYASHYFWTALELRILLLDSARGPGFWFITISRSRSDGLGGFTGRIVRGRVQSEALKGTLAALTVTKTSLEAPPR